jgi:hypothetical protein
MWVVSWSGYNAPPLRQSTMVAFKMVVSVAFSKHVTHYGPQSGFPYCNLTTHIYRAIPIHYLRWGSVDLRPETLTRNQSLYQNVGPLNNRVTCLENATLTTILKATMVD